MRIRLYFAKGLQDINKEKLVKKILEQANHYLTLPELVEVEFQRLGHSMYGETDIDRKRITLNFDLQINDIVLPLLHELLHLEQIEMGRLAKSRQGEYVWEGNVFRIDPMTIPYDEYKQLPWELDTVKKQKILLEKVLKN